MTEMRECSVEDGKIFAENEGKRVTIGGRGAIVLHTRWIDLSTGEHNLVGLDFRSDPAFASGDAAPECSERILDIFSDLADEQEWKVTDEYLNSLPGIYRDILAIFPVLEPAREAGDGLAFQTIYAALRGKYGLVEIRQACQQMADGGAMVIRGRTLACPTKQGERIIAQLTGKSAQLRETIPPFSPPPFVSHSL